MSTQIVNNGELSRFVKSAAESVGMREPYLTLFTNGLIDADLRGISTHGVIRLAAYLRGMHKGNINPNPEIKEVRGGGAISVVDGDNGIGMVVGNLAMDRAIELARQSGVGVVSVRNSNHAGMLASHVQRTVEHGMIGYFTSNGPPIMAPWGAREPAISNNPFAFSTPSKSLGPIVLDMAASAVARGKIRVAALANQAIPLGWALDEEGRDTTDAAAAMRGVVLPMGGYKGYGIAFMNEVLAVVLSGATLSMNVPTAFVKLDSTELDSWKIGHFAIALSIEHFTSLEEYLLQMDELIAGLKGATKAAGVDEILIPGEPEQRTRAERLATGIPLPDNTVAELTSAATEFGVDPITFK